MKQNLHPTFFANSVVTCACGESFVTGSTQKTIKVEICSQCHPFYTGEKRFVDTEGKVDGFLRRQEIAQQAPKKVSKRKAKRKGLTSTADKSSGTKTLKDLMSQMQR